MAPVESPVRDPTMTEGFGEEAMGIGIDDADDDDEDGDGNNADESAAAGLLGLIDDNDGFPDESILSRTAAAAMAADLGAGLTSRLPMKKKAGKKISKHGIEYPSLPRGVIKRLATTFAKTAGVGGKAKISADTLDAITQATDWFFEQLADDLQAYAKHAGRKTIDESDMITLMRRYVQPCL